MDPSVGITFLGFGALGAVATLGACWSVMLEQRKAERIAAARPEPTVDELFETLKAGLAQAKKAEAELERRFRQEAHAAKRSSLAA